MTKTLYVDVAKARSGLWMGLWLPAEAAASLALADVTFQTPEKPEELHITLAFFGDITVLGEDTVQTALQAAELYAKGADPIEGSVSGIGRFTGGEKDVIYVSFDSPGLPAFRQGLVEALGAVGIPASADHGFTPHITLAYVDKGIGSNLFPAGINPPNTPIRFDTIRVGVGDTYHEYPLEARSVLKRDSFTITKADDDRNLVFGWANVAFRVDGEQIEDHQEDIVDIEELEDAAYQFVLTFRETGVMHQGEAVGHLIESFVVTPEKLERLGLAADALPLAWWIGFHIESDEVFAKVKSGEYKMFSIQGKAIREEVV